MAAILNKHGAGELWFGIRNDGTAVGLKASEKTLRDLSQSIWKIIKYSEELDSAALIRHAVEEYPNTGGW